MRSILFAALTVLLIGPFAARADESGGTLSPLADGAGNRALAMGSAFTSIADDASATVWNPAGLGNLARRELQASHASLYGLSISEDYASFAWPSWRWGTAAITARRIGVDDIEHRDDRNQLLGEFASSETEIDLAWGRALGEAWSVGGGVKLARQEIGTSSDNGFGLDLGVLARPFLRMGREDGWTSRVSLGLALRNAIAPTIRLDQESVSEPTQIRSGASYRHPFLGEGEILVSADAIVARDVDTRLRAGLEVVPHPLLALRTGWDGDDFTAGAGIRWHSVSFDYVYENNALDAAHRFGASVLFGSSVAESRLSARRAEDEAFRARLATTFREQEDERVRELLARGDALLADGRTDEAVEAAASARALRPDGDRAIRLERGASPARPAPAGGRRTARRRAHYGRSGARGRRGGGVARAIPRGSDRRGALCQDPRVVLGGSTRSAATPRRRNAPRDPRARRHRRAHDALRTDLRS
jgi:hypothetical protein